jgi:hypothetical protein
MYRHWCVDVFECDERKLAVVKTATRGGRTSKFDPRRGHGEHTRREYFLKKKYYRRVEWAISMPNDRVVAASSDA